MSKYLVTVKYTKIAIPDKKTFDTKEEALKYQELKWESQTVRWCTVSEVDENRETLNNFFDTL